MKDITPLAICNYILQLFFIRVTRCQETHITGFSLKSVSLNGVSGIVKSKEIHQWYSIQYWIVPFTGWFTDFKYLNKEPKFIKVTRTKIIS
jgi:hypothetical protein